MPRLVLDTNAFYDFCHVLGLSDFGIQCGINEKVDYIKYKSIVEENLERKNLYIPATTVFEFVCHLRNNDSSLASVIDFLKHLSKKYAYDLLIYQYNDVYFSFDQYSETIWKAISLDYRELIHVKDMILLAKVGSEADILAVISRIILYLFVLDSCKADQDEKKKLNFVNGVFFANPFGDGSFHAVKKNVAHELYGYYQNGVEGKNKKAIFESSIKLTALMMKFYLDFMQENDLLIMGPEASKVFTSNISIQTALNKWFNKQKDVTLLDSCIELIERKLAQIGFNTSQLLYLSNAIHKMFINGGKREKNDAEDFWALRYVIDKESYIISFELELLDVIKQTNFENYTFIREFYRVQQS